MLSLFLHGRLLLALFLCHTLPYSSALTCHQWTHPTYPFSPQSPPEQCSIGQNGCQWLWPRLETVPGGDSGRLTDHMLQHLYEHLGSCTTAKKKTGSKQIIFTNGGCQKEDIANARCKNDNLKLRIIDGQVDSENVDVVLCCCSGDNCNSFTQPTVAQAEGYPYTNSMAAITAYRMAPSCDDNGLRCYDYKLHKAGICVHDKSSPNKYKCTTDRSQMTKCRVDDVSKWRPLKNGTNSHCRLLDDELLCCCETGECLNKILTADAIETSTHIAAPCPPAKVASSSDWLAPFIVCLVAAVILLIVLLIIAVVLFLRRSRKPSKPKLKKIKTVADMTTQPEYTEPVTTQLVTCQPVTTQLVDTPTGQSDYIGVTEKSKDVPTEEVADKNTNGTGVDSVYSATAPVAPEVREQQDKDEAARRASAAPVPTGGMSEPTGDQPAFTMPPSAIPTSPSQSPQETKKPSEYLP